MLVENSFYWPQLFTLNLLPIPSGFLILVLQSSAHFTPKVQMPPFLIQRQKSLVKQNASSCVLFSITGFSTNSRENVLKIELEAQILSF